VTPRSLTLVLTASLVVTGPVAFAGTTAPASNLVRPVIFVAERTTAGPTSFSLDFTGRWHRGSGAFFGDLGIHQEHGTVQSVQPDGMTSFGYADNDTITASGRVTSVCTPISMFACADEGPGGVAIVNVSYSDDGLRADRANRWMFVLSGADVTKRFHGTGWRLTQTTMTFRYADGAQTDLVGANLSGRSVGAATDASLTGGRYGSVAEAMPPCSNSDSAPLMAGVGRLTLDGGSSQPTITCPGLPQGAVGSWNQRATTWTVHGFAAGASTLYNTRLLVIDLSQTVKVR
jgi:hypothetical protein